MLLLLVEHDRWDVDASSRRLPSHPHRRHLLLVLLNVAADTTATASTSDDGVGA